MKLRVEIPDTHPPDSVEALQTVDNTAAQQASAWARPTYIDTINGRHIYELDAIPKPDPSIVTTSNVAPALQPPHVI